MPGACTVEAEEPMILPSPRAPAQWRPAARPRSRPCPPAETAAAQRSGAARRPAPAPSAAGSGPQRLKTAAPPPPGHCPVAQQTDFWRHACTTMQQTAVHSTTVKTSALPAAGHHPASCRQHWVENTQTLDAAKSGPQRLKTAAPPSGSASLSVTSRPHGDSVLPSGDPGPHVRAAVMLSVQKNCFAGAQECQRSCQITSSSAAMLPSQATSWPAAAWKSESPQHSRRKATLLPAAHIATSKVRARVGGQVTEVGQSPSRQQQQPQHACIPQVASAGRSMHLTIATTHCMNMSTS